MLGQRLKVMFCALLAVVAVLCLVATLADIGALDAAAGERVAYLLRSDNGRVCVYRLPDSRTPVLLSDVWEDALPAGEQARYAVGVGAADYAEALALLAALGA